jgi:hypothetical protein
MRNQAVPNFRAAYNILKAAHICLAKAAFAYRVRVMPEGLEH